MGQGKAGVGVGFEAPLYVGRATPVGLHTVAAACCVARTTCASTAAEAARSSSTASLCTTCKPALAAARLAAC